LSVSGELRGGRQLVVRLEGNGALVAAVLAGWPADSSLGSFGWLRVDPYRDFFAFPLISFPGTLTLDVPPELPPGTQLALQGLVLRGLNGALTNPWH
jgi:hypothetical protein